MPPNPKNPSVKTIKVNIYFLGSGKLAKDEPGDSGTSVASNIYLKQPSDETYKFTISGPNMLDIGTRSIKNLTSESLKYFKNFFANLNIDNTNINEILVKIKGHSRGGIIAKNVHKELLKFNLDTKKELLENQKFMKIQPVVLLDPYAGPINNIIAKKNRVADDGSCVVYSLNEARFSSPTTVINAKTVIFTDCSHDKTKYLATGISKRNGLYYFTGSQKLLKSYADKMLKLKDKKLDEAKKAMKDYVKTFTREITTMNDCIECFKFFFDTRGVWPTAERQLIYFKTLENKFRGSFNVIKNWINRVKKEKKFKLIFKLKIQ